MARTIIRVSAIILKDGKVLLIHRKKPQGEYWVFPGGGVEDGESIEEALVREVKEETNLDVFNHKKVFETTFDDRSTLLQPFYLCDVSDGEPEIVGEEKDINCDENYYHLEWIDIADLKDIDLKPVDAKKILLGNHDTLRIE